MQTCLYIFAEGFVGAGGLENNTWQPDVMPGGVKGISPAPQIAPGGMAVSASMINSLERKFRCCLSFRIHASTAL
jgi:hypothetical protein